MIKYIKSLTLVLAVSLWGCSFSNADTTYYQLASALTKLSSAVEATVRYEKIPEGSTSDDILAQAIAHDKSLLEPFVGYKVKIHVDNRHAIVMVCNTPATEAYLEDAGCSKELDQHHWKTKVIESCNATLKVAQVCN